MSELKTKTVKGLFWTFFDKAGSQFIGFIVTLLLARILLPQDFGLIAMASVVIAITRIFIDSGLSDSLIQKQDCVQADYSTVFIFNVVVSIVFFVVIFLSAPFIADFFGYKELIPIIRVIGLKPCIAAFSFVQTAILHKELKFHVIAKIRIPAFVVSGIVGLFMAFYDFGVWALITQTILEVFIFALLLWFVAPWRPTFRFDYQLFKEHWTYGSRLLLVNTIGTLYRNIFALVIGKYFTPAQLGYYSRADSFRTITLNNSVGIVQTVSYPVLARFQDDNIKLKNRYRQILQTTLLFLLPTAGFFILSSESIITFLLTDKWLPAAPILVVLMLAVVFSPFNSINQNILKVKRRTDLLLKVDVINNIFLIVIVILTVNAGFNYVVLTNLIISIFALFVNNHYTNRLINYSLSEQIKDLWPLLISFIISLIVLRNLLPTIYFEASILNILVTGVAMASIYTLIVFVLDRRFLVSSIEFVKLLRS